MTGPEHYSEAEKHLDFAESSDGDDEGRHLKYAAVHAQLAHAAATALSGIEKNTHNNESNLAALGRADSQAWIDIASEAQSGG